MQAHARAGTSGPPRAKEAGAWCVTPWDVREAGKAAAFAAVALLLTWLVTAATDEGGVAWSERAARTLPLAPLCSGLGTWLGRARALARGEGRALATLGRGPLASAAGAVAGGAALALAAALAIGVTGRVDVRGFYPVAATRNAYAAAPDGAFVEVETGIRIEAGGAILPPGASPDAPAGGSYGRAQDSPSSSSGLPPFARLAAAVSTAIAGVAFPLLGAGDRKHRTRRAASGLLAAAVTIALFQASAAGILSPLWAVVPPLALVAAALRDLAA